MFTMTKAVYQKKAFHQEFAYSFRRLVYDYHAGIKQQTGKHSPGEVAVSLYDFCKTKAEKRVTGSYLLQQGHTSESF